MIESPFSGDVDPRQMAMMMRDPSRIESMLTSDVPGVGASPAAMLADVISVMRSDNYRLAVAVGVDDVEANQMTPERAAELVTGVVQGDGWELIEAFNEVAETRTKILREVLSEEEFEQFTRAKVDAMHTDDPDTFDQPDVEE